MRTRFYVLHEEIATVNVWNMVKKPPKYSCLQWKLIRTSKFVAWMKFQMFSRRRKGEKCVPLLLCTKYGRVPGPFTFRDWVHSLSRLLASPGNFMDCLSKQSRIEQTSWTCNVVEWPRILMWAEMLCLRRIVCSCE